MYAHAHIRWMIRRDLPEVLAISAESSLPWSEDDAIAALGRRDTIGKVLEHSERVVGFAVYRLQARKLELLHFAIAPQFRGNGLARKLMEGVTHPLGQRRPVLDAMIRETDLELLQFFRHMGFTGSLWRGAFGDVDGVRMRFDVRELAAA